MDLHAILQEQLANRFKDLAGANAAVTLPISDRLVSRLVRESLPLAGPVQDLDLEAHAPNSFNVRLKLTRPAFLPSISLKLFIEGQPRLPESAIVVFRVEMAGGLMGLAAPAIRMMGALPPGLQLEGDRLEVDLHRLLAQYGAAAALDYVDDLRLTTDERRFVISLRVSVPAVPGGSGLS